MPRRNWLDRISDILDAAQRIREYTDGFDLDAFTRDRKTVDAVVRNLEIVGEASARVPDDVQARYGQVPWREMRAMRNLLSHAYFDVDVGVVWKTAREDLPVVINALERILRENG